jgi:serine/threonine protein kinase
MVHRDLKPENILVVAPDDGLRVELLILVLRSWLRMRVRVRQEQSWGHRSTCHPNSVWGNRWIPVGCVQLGAMFYEIVSAMPFRLKLYQQSSPNNCRIRRLVVVITRHTRRITVGIMNALAKDPVERPQMLLRWRQLS